MGRGSLVGHAIVQHPQVDAISFTGSQGVGRAIAQAAVGLGKKVQLEMGGKNPQVVLDDADLKLAVELSANSGFFSTGQRCTASSRLIVTDGIYDKFIAALAERTKALKVGAALEAGTEIGPVVSQAQLDQDMSYVSLGQQEGGRLLAGGGLVERPTKGFFMAPTLLADTDASMRINREEVFGPVVSVIRVKDYEAALAMANDTLFGLSAGIATHLAEIRDPLQAPLAGRHGDGQPANGRRRLSRPLRRPQGLVQRRPGTRPLCGRVLHGGEDGLHPGLNRLSALRLGFRQVFLTRRVQRNTELTEALRRLARRTRT